MSVNTQSRQFVAPYQSPVDTTVGQSCPAYRGRTNLVSVAEIIMQGSAAVKEIGNMTALGFLGSNMPPVENCQSRLKTVEITWP
ncbi:MAG: hypothetical protein HYU39_03420 [Thaumarchaeota archaeon]|nr:hypothetical protein [Nitrososphaerota archaeon]